MYDYEARVLASQWYGQLFCPRLTMDEVTNGGTLCLLKTSRPLLYIQRYRGLPLWIAREQGEGGIVDLDAAEFADRLVAIVEDEAADDDQVADHNHGLSFMLSENTLNFAYSPFLDLCQGHGHPGTVKS